MAAAVGKFAANTLLKKQMKQYKDKNVEGGDDPYFAMVENPKRPGKFKKVKKQIPAYIPEHDAEILASVRRRAYRLDMCLFNLLGIRFGWEAVIGLVPLAGDAIGVLFALMLFKTCCGVEGGLSQSIKMRMLLNIIADFVVGLVPFIGDLADAAFKCNTRNLRLLEVVLDKKYKPQALRDERNLAGVDREQRRKNRASGIYRPHDPPPATAFDFSDDDEEDDRRRYDTSRDDGVRPPPAARQPEERRSSRAYGWFSGGGRSGSKRDQPNTQAPMREASTRQQTGSIRR